MAVVQISKIQIRRGQKNAGSGIPQLSSGEMGWAIDSQELYVGNGAVSEGAPSTGNTKVLTQHDNLFTLIDTYGYRTNDPYVVTGDSATNPVQRTLQDRLDDTVTGRAFGLNGIEGADATVKLQTAIDQLYLNSASIGTPQSRVVLSLEPGVYSLNGTVYLPPFTTIVGAGSDKTIIKKTTTGDLFRTENQLIAGTANKATRSDDSGSSLILQARNIKLEGLTLESTVAGSNGLVLQSCRDSIFRDIKIKGTWSSGDSIPAGYASEIGIELNSLSGSVETTGNLFERVEVNSFGYGVMSNWDINNNTWTDCIFNGLGYGFVFGIDMVLGAASSGQSTGPVNNTITHSEFTNINYQGIWIHNGTKNSSSNNSFVLVGNDGSSDANPSHSIIKYVKVGNSTSEDHFARTKELSYTAANLTGKVYYSEVETLGSWTWKESHQITISRGTSVKAIRLPGYKDQYFEVDYTLTSNNYPVSRSGTLSIQMETSTPKLEYYDDYYFTGTDAYLESIQFDVTATDEDGSGSADTISISYTSVMPSDDQTIMTFSATSKQS